ncbi:MAG TPA: c-type cytochrome [Burkholderiales bacterium]|jgi:cytochrome c553|nr:c-type cytochrome [Burkholderiales bacterium]
MDARLVAAALASALLSAAAHGQIAVKGDPAKAQQMVTQVCAACHGADGNSAIPTNPSLAGQHPEYTFKQLTNFKAEAGKTPDRPSPVMTAIVANLSPDDMANAALYFNGQEPKPRAARDPQLVKLGQTIYRGGILAKGVAACASCHGPNGAGIPAQFPRMSGQHAQYTADQLKAFRAGTRANDPNRMMRTVALKLTDREIDAVAQYIQGLR